MAAMGTFAPADPIPPARPAATVVVARPAAPGVEVLVLRRSATSRFVPGFVVFPGGSIDGGDRALADAWFGSEDEAPRACAVRELTEEAGLALTARGLVERGAEAVGPEPPSIRQLPEIGRWIAGLDIHFPIQGQTSQAGDVDRDDDAHAVVGEALDQLHRVGRPEGAGEGLDLLPDGEGARRRLRLARR